MHSPPSSPTDGGAHARRTRAPAPGFVLVLFLLFLGWLAAFAFTLWRMHEDAIANGLARAETLVRSLEEHLTQSLKVVDITANTMDPSADADGEALGRRLGSALRQSPHLRSLSLIDEDGTIVASSNPANIGVTVETGSFYPAVRPDAELLRIAQPWTGRDLASAQPTSAADPARRSDLGFVPVLRRLPLSKEPRWLLAALNPDYFSNNFLHRLTPAEGSMQWLRYDGLLLLSSDPVDRPGARGSAGDVPERVVQRESGTLMQTLPGGRKVLTAFRASSQFPAVAVVHIDLDGALAAWQDDARRLASVVLPILIALSIVGGLAWRRKLRIASQTAELAREQHLAASVFQASSDSIVLTTPAGTILSVNPAFERINGYRAEEVLGKNPRILRSGVQGPAFYRELWTTLNETGHWRGEIVNRRKSGDHYTALLTIDAVLGPNGNPTHYISLATDISARKRDEKLLAERTTALSIAKEAAEAANRAKTTFLANMSHELRTPLNGILGMTGLALRQARDPQLKEQLALIDGASHQLLTIINDVLDISSLEADRLTLEQRPFRLGDLVDRLTAVMTPTAAEKGLMFRAYFDTQQVDTILLGDPTRIGQILQNLAGNAVKFTQKGGVNLRMELADAEDETVMLRFAVQDTGIGIATDALSRLFIPFEQLDGSPTRKFGGTGLGLAISRRLARMMGGDIRVDSQPGQGSTFWFVARLKRLGAGGEPQAGAPDSSERGNQA